MDFGFTVLLYLAPFWRVLDPAGCHVWNLNFVGSSEYSQYLREECALLGFCRDPCRGRLGILAKISLVTCFTAKCDISGRRGVVWLH